MPGLIRGVARTAAVVGTASAVNGRVQHRQQAKWAQQGPAEPQYQEQPQAYQQPPPPPAAAAAAAPSTIDQLKELGELKAQGILTDDEFAQQKAKILNS